MIYLLQLKHDIQKFLKETKTPPSRLGMVALNCRHVIFEILRGEREPRLKTIDKIYATIKSLEGKPYIYRPSKKGKP